MSTKPPRSTRMPPQRRDPSMNPTPAATLTSTPMVVIRLGLTRRRTSTSRGRTSAAVTCARRAEGWNFSTALPASGQDDAALLARFDPPGDLLVDAGHHPVEVGARGLEALVRGAHLHHPGHALEL